MKYSQRYHLSLAILCRLTILDAALPGLLMKFHNVTDLLHIKIKKGSLKSVIILEVLGQFFLLFKDDNHMMWFLIRNTSLWHT